ARDFLLCAGWCLPEDELDDALASVLSKSSLPADAHFSYDQLTAALRFLKKGKDNISVGALADAFLSVTPEEGFDMHRLREVVCAGKHPALSANELDEV
ncbi:GIP, partial [Symbiodinium pilosum]